MTVEIKKFLKFLLLTLKHFFRQRWDNSEQLDVGGRGLIGKEGKYHRYIRPTNQLSHHHKKLAERSWTCLRKNVFLLCWVVALLGPKIYNKFEEWFLQIYYFLKEKHSWKVPSQAISQAFARASTPTSEANTTIFSFCPSCTGPQYLNKKTLVQN